MGRLMRCLAEPLPAGEPGGLLQEPFLGGEVQMPAVLDEAAVWACSVYVDLDPIRAGVAETPEKSPFTSAYERIQARVETSAAVAAEGRRRCGADLDGGETGRYTANK